MQHPQYSFSGNQSSARAPSEGYSVFQNNSGVADSQLKSLSKSEDSANVSQQPQPVNQRGSFQGQSHNFSDQPATTWHWQSQGQTSEPALPIQEAPRAEHVPANGQSFAPPVDLGQLQRIDRPQIQQKFASDIYKSPIDRPYMGKARRNVEQSDATGQTNNDLDDAISYFKEQSENFPAVPERDEVTDVKEFLSRDEANEALFVEPSLQETTAGTGKQVIVLRSQSPQELAEARAKEAVSSKPDAQLLTPNFESYVGSPVLDTTREVYQDQTQWKVYTPTQEVVDLPPPAVFESLPKVSVQTPAVEFSPPAPKNYAFEPAEEVAALPEPYNPPAPKIEEDLFQAPPAPVRSNDVFEAASVRAEAPSEIKSSFETKPVETRHWKDTPVNPVSVSKVKATTPSYRFERYETGADVEATTTAITVAHTTPVTQPAVSESAWLSPWWMLVCLVPFAMYLVTRRGGEVDEYYDACDEVGERPRLPPEMIERPGYSKSDAIYGEKDEYFATEQLALEGQRRSTGDRIPMATHLRAAEKSRDDFESVLPAETVTTDSFHELDFASSNSIQTETELELDASPNFRSQPDDEYDDEGEIPDWLS